MKTYFNIPKGEYTPSQVRAAAWRMFAAQVHAPYRRGILAPWLDHRYNFNREAEAEFNRIVKFNDIEAARAKYIARHHSGSREANADNIKATPLVRDYYRFRADLRAVHADHLEFYGRNHWAKNGRDLQILAILSKNFAKYQESRKAYPLNTKKK